MTNLRVQATVALPTRPTGSVMVLRAAPEAPLTGYLLCEVLEAVGLETQTLVLPA